MRIRWNKKKVMQELRKLNFSPSASEIKRIDYPLFSACLRYFGKLNKAKRSANLKITNPHKIFVPHSSFRKMTPELGYVIGAILGDGWIYKSHLVLDTKDKDFAEYFAKLLIKWVRKKPKIYKLPSRKKVDNRTGKMYTAKSMLRVSLASIEICKFLQEKLSDFSWVKEASSQTKRMIVRGLFDAEGSINIENKIEIANKNSRIRKLVKDLCFELGIPTSEISQTKIRILGGLKMKNKFLREIGITILRKRKRLEEHLQYHSKRLQIYNLVMNLREKGFSDKKIQKELRKRGYKISKDTIAGWIYRKIKPLSL